MKITFLYNNSDVLRNTLLVASNHALIQSFIPAVLYHRNTKHSTVVHDSIVNHVILFVPG